MTIRRRSNGTYELRVTHRLLEKPDYSTHDSETDAAQYRDKLRAMLDSGVVPQELQARQPSREVLMRKVIQDYLDEAPISSSDRPMVEWLLQNLDLRYVSGLTVLWVDQWVQKLKRKDHNAPGTIRKKVECLARIVDWYFRRKYDQRQLPTNPLRTLPVGYSTYRESDGPKKVDKKRDRRLHDGEEERISQAITGEWKNPNRQRSLKSENSDEMLLMFRLIVNTGLRLREAYTLRRGDIRFDLMTIHVRRTKTDSARDIPITPQVYNYLQAGPLPTDPAELLFSAWDGEPDSLDKVSNKLSARFSTIFKYVESDDLTEHDLRHEATCRWMLMTNEKGQWRFRPEEVKRITGHKTQSQFERYLSLRGSEFADRLWEGHERPPAPVS